ncbi:MAG: zinc ribbon domain-containing protein [Proteobacteria bacterium]|nr:zinc ribbon domain-containing protein [Pseudomonadota bacterium]
MTDVKCCQSCGLPFNDEHRQFIAKELDGSDSIYCTFCYRDGAFTNPNATANDMIEIGVTELAKKIGEPAARAELSKIVPQLKRWK